MFAIGDKVFYPMHGAGVIEAIEEREILGDKQFYYVMNIRDMLVLFPLESNLRIRQIVDLDTLEDALKVFNDDVSAPTLNPSQRYRSNLNKMKSGDIYEGAQVIRDLVHISKKRPLATSDKNMLDNARQILISELVLVKGIAHEQADCILTDAIAN
ncbi:CarD family transcriptional regulator [Desulfitibacter alkalitolerans]|uniref:CarD family transcriptional regulator n=1 Tax=Desulfitibacter alkalitolerans TaxID=264641 RepID=UPI000488743D|nr:CarD family transcriptional regulator [Desulfitibacter alkalitolerans]